MTKNAPRGRPRKFDKSEVLDLIVNVFWEKGFSRTSLDDLSTATSLSRPSLYAAYGNKLSMYLMALDVFGKRMATEAVGTLATSPDLKTGLELFYDAALDIYLGPNGDMARGCLVFTTAVTEAATEPEIKEVLSAQLDGFDRALRAQIAQHAPHLGPAVLEVATNLASGTLLNLATRARAGTPRAALIKIAASTADTVATLAAKSRE
jgi:TetR/AcrR family transcriptional regulator, copper-responsive repressor